MKRFLLSVFCAPLLVYGADTAISTSDFSWFKPATAVTGEDVLANANSPVTLSANTQGNPTVGVSYHWQQVEGIAVSLESANSPEAHFLAPAITGPLVFSLTVVDDYGLIAMDTVTVTVDPRQPQLASNQ